MLLRGANWTLQEVDLDIISSILGVETNSASNGSNFRSAPGWCSKYSTLALVVCSSPTSASHEASSSLYHCTSRIPLLHKAITQVSFGICLFNTEFLLSFHSYNVDALVLVPRRHYAVSLVKLAISRGALFPFNSIAPSDSIL